MKNKMKNFLKKNSSGRWLSMTLAFILVLGMIPTNGLVQAAGNASETSLWEQALQQDYTSFKIDFNADTDEDGNADGNPDKAGGHVQGICVDDDLEYIYFSSSNALIKMDMKTRKIVADVQFGTLGFDKEYGLHLGCIDYYNGWIYGSLIAPVPNGKNYLVAFDTSKITERNMDGLQLKKDGGLSAVLLTEPTEDFRATMNYSEKNLDEGGTHHYQQNNGHRFGAGGVDGVTVGKMPGDTSDQLYVIVACNNSGTSVYFDRYDMDNSILAFYSLENIQGKLADFNYDVCKELSLDNETCVTADDTLYVWTGSIQYGIQNLEYEWDTGDIVLYTYPNDSGFGEDMFVIDGNKAPEMKELQVGQHNTDSNATVQAFAKESATYYKSLERFQNGEFTSDGYPIVKYGVLKCICGNPAHHQYEEGDCWGDTGVSKNDYPICSVECIHAGANLGVHWLDNDGKDTDYLYIVDDINNCVNVSLYKRTTNDDGSFSLSKATAGATQAAALSTEYSAVTLASAEDAGAEAEKTAYTKAEADAHIAAKTYPTAVGKVFAGWYTDEQYETTYAGDTESNITTVYAKFVDENVLSVKFQLRGDTGLSSSSTDLRLITTVDTLQYQSVGFDVTINGKTQPFTSKTVYETLKGYTYTTEGETNEVQYTPSGAFSIESSYFMAHKLTGIPKSFFGEKIQVVPKWTTLDGTVVTGVARTFTINEVVESGYNELGWMDFEQSSDQMLITKNSERPIHQRVAYSDNDVNVAPLQSMGAYAFRINGTGMVNPGGSMWSKTTYGKGSILNFMMYVEADASAVQEKALKVTSTTAGKENTVTLSSKKFNQWVNVSVVLADKASKIDFAVDFNDGNGSSYLGNGNVMIYLDNVRVVQMGNADSGETSDADKGLTFETEEDLLMIGNRNVNYSIASYSESGISPYSDSLGSKALLMDAINREKYPAIDIKFGKKYAKGTVLTFMAYAQVAADSVGSQKVQFECKSNNTTANSNSVGQSSNNFNEWIRVTVTLNYDSDVVWLFENLDNTNKFDTADVKIYLDNIRIYNPNEGFTFERQDDILMATQYGEYAYEHVAYGEETVAPYDVDSGKYALQVSRTADNDKYPGIFIDLGTTYSTGTKIVFLAYAKADASATAGKSANIECYTRTIFSGGDSGRKWNAASLSSTGFNEWIRVTITLQRDTSKLEIFENMDSAGLDCSLEFYLDNIRIYNPNEGFTFERQDDILMATQYGEYAYEHVAYGEETVAPYDVNSGKYALQVSRTADNGKYPGIFIDLGATYSTGTKIVFLAYAKADASATAGKSVQIECMTRTSFSGGAREWNAVSLSSTGFNEWIQVTITLQQDTSKLEIFENMDSAGLDCSLEFYLDNMCVADSSEGWTFETASDLTSISQHSGTYSIVSYAKAGITPYDTMGKYALELDGTKQIWPGIKINLGQTYAAGTKVKFMLYVDVDEDIVQGRKVSMECAASNSGWKWQQMNLNSTAYNQWIEVEITLNENASDTLRLMANFERGTIFSGSSFASELNISRTYLGSKPVKLYFDNFQIVTE